MKGLGRVLAPLAVTLALAMPGFVQPASAAYDLGVRSGPRSVSIAAQPVARVTEGPRAPSTRTGPGVGDPAKHDALASRVVQGLILILVAAAVVGWIFRARVRNWMVGRSGH